MQERVKIALDGDWQFQIDPHNSTSPDIISEWRTIPVPSCWQAAFPDLLRYSGAAWYRRTFEIPEGFDPDRQRAWIQFNAVDYFAQVWVNGVFQGEHEGGYTPFVLNISEDVVPGSNELLVKVEDTAMEGLETNRWYQPPLHSVPRDFTDPSLAVDLPHGKQAWYYDASGIWGNVTLELTVPTLISGVKVTPNIADMTAEIEVTVISEAAEHPALPAISIHALGIHGQALQNDEQYTASEVNHEHDHHGGMFVYTTSIPMPKANLWSPASPFLYEAAVTLETPEGTDRQRATFGMRSIEAVNGRLYLNGRPIFLLSALDQDFYPDTIYTPPSDQFIEDQFRKAKELGLNSLRCHIKVPDPRYLDWADRIGLLIWEEIPSWRTFTLRRKLGPDLGVPEIIQDRAQRILVDMIERDYNHPSLIAYTIVNEDWGTRVSVSPEDRSWLKLMYNLSKQLDPTRLVVDNSPCPGEYGYNFHVKTDLDDFHAYFTMPDHYYNYLRWIESFAERPDWTFSPYGDAERTGGEPLILSEFGNWGLPSLARLRQHYGGDPSWFKTGGWWSVVGGETTWPMGVEERFKRYKLDRIWEDYEQLAEASQWNEFYALKAQIEALRLHDSIVGYVITEFSDIYWESNGLLDFARNPKAFHNEFATINAEDVIVANWRRLSYWTGELVRLPVVVSHFSDRELRDCTVSWHIEGDAGDDLKGSWQITEPLPEATATTTGEIAFRVPALDSSTPATLRLELTQSDGTPVARNHLKLTFFPAAYRRASGSLYVADPPSVSALALLDPDNPVSASMTRIGASAEEMPSRMESATPPASTAPQPSVTQTTAISPMGAQGSASEALPSAAITRPATPEPPLATVLRGLGYTPGAPLTSDTQVAVATTVDRDLLDWVAAGGSLLFLPKTNQSPFMGIYNRTGPWSGDWCTNFNWVRKDGDLFARIPFENPLGFQFVNVAPTAVMLAFGDDEQDDVLSGMVAGWVRYPATLTGQFRYGQGKVVISTFDLITPAGRDPVATIMLHDLIAYTGSDRCQPKKVVQRTDSLPKV